jgi:hypothetical protein
MPIIGVNRDRLFQALGRTYSAVARCQAQYAHRRQQCFVSWHEFAMHAVANLCLSRSLQLMKSSTNFASSTALSWTMWCATGCGAPSPAPSHRSTKLLPLLPLL